VNGFIPPPNRGFSIVVVVVVVVDADVDNADIVEIVTVNL